MRKSFVPRPGYVFVVGDYAQLEMRLFAEYTQEPILLEAFSNPKNDVHQMLADRLGLPRYVCKTIFYGVLYGAEENKVAEVAGARDSDEARHILDTIRNTVPSLLNWRSTIAKQLADKGYIESLFGWRNYYPLYFSPLPNEQSAALREAANMPMQGTAAGLAKIAMRESRDVMQRYEVDMLLQVHDEILWEVPEVAAPMFARRMTEVGSHCGEPTIGVPLIFQCAQGLSWAEAKGEH